MKVLYFHRTKKLIMHILKHIDGYVRETGTVRWACCLWAQDAIDDILKFRIGGS